MSGCLVFAFCVVMSYLHGAIGSETFTSPTESCSSSQNLQDPASSLIEGIYSAVKKAECSLANPLDYPDHYSLQDGEEFDFIIVGAGSA